MMFKILRERMALRPKTQHIVKEVTALGIIVALVVAAQFWDVQALLRQALAGITELGFWGPILFVGVYILATVLFVPGSILTLGAGAVFGVVEGAIAVLVGATLGATAAFGVGRYLARGWVARRIEDRPTFKVIDQAVAAEGFKIVLLTRLSPVFPFNLLNYAFAVTQVSLKDFVLGSMGMLPGTILYVYLGSLAGNLALVGTDSQPSHGGLVWTLRLLGLIATIAVTAYITRIARAALTNRILP